jgi:hypothetical protein
MRDIQKIIEDAGGPERIAKAAGYWTPETGPQKGKRVPKLSHWAIRKWSGKGIPEWHWPLLRTLVEDLSVAELHAANEAVRAAA